MDHTTTTSSSSSSSSSNNVYADAFRYDQGILQPSLLSLAYSGLQSNSRQLGGYGHDPLQAPAMSDPERRQQTLRVLEQTLAILDDDDFDDFDNVPMAASNPVRTTISKGL